VAAAGAVGVGAAVPPAGAVGVGAAVPPAGAGSVAGGVVGAGSVAGGVAGVGVGVGAGAVGAGATGAGGVGAGAGMSPPIPSQRCRSSTVLAATAQSTDFLVALPRHERIARAVLVVSTSSVPVTLRMFEIALRQSA
jgi:hypothetical protein